VADAPDDEDDEDDVSHTKVFKPPSDDDFDSPSTEASETTSEDTAVVSEDGYVCPSCEDRYGADASFDYCPTCGSELESA
jgi:RNA polymerase subunit RPABC4/transcription elongation factor Spt4